MDIETDSDRRPRRRRARRRRRRIYRHRLPVRLMHWINVVCLTILLGSGLNIFNAHPTLYWGHDSVTGTPWLSIRGMNTPQGPVGKTRIGGAEFTTTGVLGVSTVDGRTTERALSELGDDPRAAVAGDGAPLAPLLRLAVRRQRRRLRALHDLQPAPGEGPGADARRAEEHRPLDRRPPQVQAPDRRRGDALQRAAEPDLPDRHLRPAAAGRLRRAWRCRRASTPSSPAGSTCSAAASRRARCTSSPPSGLLLFVVVHVVEVIVAGVWNEMRSMITGWYKVPPDPASKEVRP